MTLSTSQQFLSEFKSSATNVALAPSLLQIGLPPGTIGIHLSSHIFIVLTLPILFISPKCNAALPFKMACQTCELFFFFFAFIKSELWKYFPVRTLAHKDVGLVNSLHPCLPSMARLNKYISLNPMPPALFGRANSSHFLQCNPRPAELNNFSDHPSAKLFILEVIFSKAPVVLLPKAVGSPRYFSSRASVQIPIICFTSSLISSLLFGLKNIADFALLTNCPDPLLYMSKIS